MKKTLSAKLIAAREQDGLSACVYHKGYQYTAPIWSLHRGAYHWLRAHATKPTVTYFETRTLNPEPRTPN